MNLPDQICGLSKFYCRAVLHAKSFSHITEITGKAAAANAISQFDHSIVLRCAVIRYKELHHG